MRYELDTKDGGYAGEMDIVYWVEDGEVKEGRVQSVEVQYGELYEIYIDDYGYCKDTFDFQQTFYYWKENAEEALNVG